MGDDRRRHVRDVLWFHRLAVITAAATLVLLFVGGGVTSRDAGLAFPDWPTSNGQLINPTGWWQSIDTRWEHGHRLIGWTVGMGAIGLCILGWRRPNDSFLRVGSSLALIAIIAQGVMGGLRVTERSTAWAVVHGVWGQACFSLMVCLAAASSRWWQSVTAHNTETARIETWWSALRLSFLTTLLLLEQLIAGAITRHTDHGFLIHIAGAILVTALIARLIIALESDGHGLPWPRRFAVLLGLLLVVQLALGMVAYLVTGGSSSRVVSPTFIQWAVPTLHVVTGALLLAVNVLLTLAIYYATEVSTMEGLNGLNSRRILNP